MNFKIATETDNDSSDYNINIKSGLRSSNRLNEVFSDEIHVDQNERPANEVVQNRKFNMKSINSDSEEDNES